jgi:hypothetical protein
MGPPGVASVEQSEGRTLVVVAILKILIILKTLSSGWNASSDIKYNAESYTDL